MTGRDETTGRRGLDALTAAELAATRRGFWDEAFTDVLVRRLPAGARVLLDVGCGLATAAHALLPLAPALSYVGVDADAGRLEEARRLLEGAPCRDRVELRAGRAEALPCGEGEADVALCAMTLQHLADPGAALGEIARALAPGGTLIAVEPDNTGNAFYFDGVLEGVTAAFGELFAAQRRARRPADTAVGPGVAALAERVGLGVLEFLPHVLGKARRASASEFFAGLARLADVVGASLPPGAPEVERCRTAIAAQEAAVGPAAVGWACQLVPVFVCVARKPPDRRRHGSG